MPRIVLSLDADDLLAVMQGRFTKQTPFPPHELCDTVNKVLTDVEESYGEGAGIVQLDLLDDGDIHVIAAEPEGASA